MRAWLLAAGMMVFCAWPAAAVGAAEPGGEPERFFETSIRPLLAERCLSCHGPKRQESGLRLDSRANLLSGGDSGEMLVTPGNPEVGLLMKAVRREGDLKMPPEEKDRLSPEQVALLAAWVRDGLAWPQSAPAPLALEETLRQARANHWALQPLAEPVLPAAPAGQNPGRGPLDRYVVSKLASFGLSLSPEAERATLLRRVTFDLHGLPPTPAELDAFLADTAPDAYERLVDRLLTSPRYGERWGRHWLDVARYADTRGYAFGKERNFPYAYTYRDYVVRAWNADLPYNQFLLEQLAADKLPPTPTGEHLAGLGFLTVGRKFDNQADDIDEQIDVVGRGLLGLTVGCARCHDHKYDPIPTEDYYSLFGVFASTEVPGELPAIGNPATTEGFENFQRELERLRAEAANYRAERRAAVIENARKQATDYLVRVISQKPDALLAKLPFLSLAPDELRPKLVERWRRYLREQATAEHPVWGPWLEFSKLDEGKFAEQSPEVLARWSQKTPGLEAGQLNPLVGQALAAGPLPDKSELARRYGKLLGEAYAAYGAAGKTAAALEKIPPAQAQLAKVLVDSGSPTEIPDNELRDYLTRAEFERERELKKKVDSHEARSPGAPPRAMAVVDRAAPVEPRVAIRGNVNRPGKQVPRQFLGLLSGETRRPFTQGSGRLELAQAVSDAQNPLTPRVIVNRLWQHHFGQALVNSPSDFGLRSDPPSHPELLNYLAWRLRQNGWSLKGVQREILLSATYRQTSLPPGPPKSSAANDPLEVDPENRLLWRQNRKRLEFEPLRDALFAVADNLSLQMYGRAADLTKPEFHRRAVYGFIDRQDLPGVLRVFDFASPDASSPGRPRTIVPQQALFLMNAGLVVEQAERLAQRAEITGLSEPRERVQALYRLVYGRPAHDDEIQLGLDFVAAASNDAAPETKLAPWSQYCQLLLLANEFVYID